jgi:hypothetical protein
MDVAAASAQHLPLRLLSERILETTARVLARQISAEAERSAIHREIQGEAAAYLATWPR